MSNGCTHNDHTQEALKIFNDSGALLHGHFLLTSGRHSDKYMQCAQALKYPQYTEKLAGWLVEDFADDGIDLVIGPAVGGIIVAYEAGRQLGVPAIFAERADGTGTMTLRRGFCLSSSQRVLVVEDVTTTGGSVKEVMELVEASGAVVAGVGVLVDRSNGAVDLGVKQRSVVTMEVPSWDAEECPLCREGSPAVKPGSRR